MMKAKVIAVFEDDIIDRFIYQQLFNLYEDQPTVLVFDNIEDGLRVAKQVPFDMVYIDLHFQGDFGGESILKQLRKVSGPGMVTLAMASLLQAGDHERVLRAGFDLCLEKLDFFRGVNMMQLS